MLFPKFMFSICLSGAFEDDKDEYKKCLQQVQKNNSHDLWNQWTSHFIQCLILTKRRIQYRIRHFIILYNNKIFDSKAFATPIRRQIISEFFKYYLLIV